MNSRLYIGEVMHARLVPVEHRFIYPLYWYVFDLDELPQLDREVRGFGYNRRSLVSIRDADYLRGEGPIRERLMALLRERGCDDGIARVELVTMARCLNYIFIPVSFYYCYRADGSLRCAVAEVNNTFRERHLYVLDRPSSDPARYPARYEHAKEFHVSPFNDLRGTYEFNLSALGEDMDVRVNLVRDGAHVIDTGIRGTAQPLTSETLRRALWRHPFTAALNIPRIVWQASKLYFRKKLPVHQKPPPSSRMTFESDPTFRERLAVRAIFSFFSLLRRGVLTVVMPDGTRRRFGGAEPGREVEMRVPTYRFFWRMLRDGDVGFGECYVEREMECDDPTELLALFVDNAEFMDDRNIHFSWVGRVFNRIRHELRRNTLIGSRRNIEAHYDLGNEFYRTFLDESMMYSAAIHLKPDETLEQSQKNKLKAIIRKARLGPEDHVLEIGCGWGGFAIEAARTTGCRVTGITLSREQLALGQERVAAAGLQDRIHLELRDYRAMEGQFTKIVSIEMLEAVGHEYLGVFFSACDRLLASDGLVVLQVITIPDQRYDAYRRSTDWIQKHIFPGGVLPSLTALSAAMTRHSRLMVEELENIGPHYALTLREWRRRFEQHAEALEKMGYDKTFQRKWRYYLCYCEAGFEGRFINDLHLVLTRPGNRKLENPFGAANPNCERGST